LKSRKAKIEVWNADDLADVADFNKFGLSGSPTWVVKVYTPSAERRKGMIIRGDPEEVAKKLADMLEGMGVLE